MRRGIGVAHIQQQRQTQQQMAQLGAHITAERVGQIAEQMETLEQQLRTLAAKHKEEIKHDPLVRARFRQLADSLGVDLISSKKNVFAGALGLGDFYYSLAGKVVEVCMKEQKFCGSYVPLARVVQVLQRQFDAQAAATVDSTEETAKKAKRRTTINEDDVTVALKKLDCLGAGYNTVTLARVRYIQTTPDGAIGSDEVPLLNYVLTEQKRRVDAAEKAASRTTSTSGGRLGAALPAESRARAENTGGPLLGVAYVLGAHPLGASESGVALDAVPLSEQCVSLRLPDLATSLGWPVHRVRAVVERMVQDGAVWIDYPQGPDSKGRPVPAQRGHGSSNSGGGRCNRCADSKSSKTCDRHANEENEEGQTVYWFVSLTTSAEEKV